MVIQARRKAMLSLGLGGLLLALGPGKSLAQTGDRTVRIGLLLSGSAAQWAPFESALVAGLREQGYLEGRNLTVLRRYGELQGERIRGSASELGALNLDSIVTSCTGTTRAVAAAAGRTPVIMASVSDPVLSGLVKSLARPGGQITGRASQSYELIPKRLQFLRAVLPEGARIAVLLNGNEPGLEERWSEAEAAARALNLTLVRIASRNPAELDATLDKLARSDVQGVMVLTDDPMSIEHRDRIDAAVLRARLPSITGLRASAEAGGLMSYGEDLADSFRLTAGQVVKVAHGSKPEELPIEQPTRFHLVINLKTAKALGISIPQSLLLRADEVIQ